LFWNVTTSLWRTRRDTEIRLVFRAGAWSAPLKSTQETPESLTTAMRAVPAAIALIESLFAIEIDSGRMAWRIMESWECAVMWWDAPERCNVLLDVPRLAELMSSELPDAVHPRSAIGGLESLMKLPPGLVERRAALNAPQEARSDAELYKTQSLLV
jgi:hypothetical protein